MMNFKKLNQTGIAHLEALVIIVVALAAVGTYLLVASHAATCVDATWKQGSSGTCVLNIQTLANHKLPYIPSYPSPTLNVTGKYDKTTKDGIIRMQKSWATVLVVPTDGIVGKETWKILCSTGTTTAKQGGPFTPAEQAAYDSAGCSSITSY